MGETDWGGKLGVVLMARAMLSKSLIHFSVYGWGCVPSLSFDLRPNYGGGNEDNGNLIQRSHAHSGTTQRPQPYSRPPPTHTSARGSWTLTDKSESDSCGVTAPFSWVLVCTRFCLCPPRVCFPVLCKFWPLYGGVNGDLLQEGLCHMQLCCTRVPAPAVVHCWPIPPQKTLKHTSVSVSVGCLGSSAHKVCLSPLSVSGRYGVWF